MVAPLNRQDGGTSTGLTVMSDDAVSYASWLLRYMANSIEGVDNWYDYEDYANNTLDYQFSYNEI